MHHCYLHLFQSCCFRDLVQVTLTVKTLVLGVGLLWEAWCFSTPKSKITFMIFHVYHLINTACSLSYTFSLVFEDFKHLAVEMSKIHASYINMYIPNSWPSFTHHLKSLSSPLKSVGNWRLGLKACTKRVHCQQACAALTWLRGLNFQSTKLIIQINKIPNQLHLRNLTWIPTKLPCFKGVTFSKSSFWVSTFRGGGYSIETILRTEQL